MKYADSLLKKSMRIWCQRYLNYIFKSSKTFLNLRYQIISFIQKVIKCWFQKGIWYYWEISVVHWMRVILRLEYILCGPGGCPVVANIYHLFLSLPYKLFQSGEFNFLDHEQQNKYHYSFLVFNRLHKFVLGQAL